MNAPEPALPRVVWEGTLHIFGADVKVSVLDDGRRIVDHESFGALLDAMERDTLGDGLPINDASPRDLHRLARFVNGRGIPEDI